MSRSSRTIASLPALNELLADTDRYHLWEHGVVDLYRHPLLIMRPFDPKEDLQRFAASQRRKRVLIEEAIAENNWHRVLSLVERPWRGQAFDTLAHELNDQDYWSTLAWVWRDTEYPGTHIDMWVKLFSSSRPCREHLMGEEDRAVYEQLPSVVTAFRGISGKKTEDKGVSWTLDKSKARWFAKRNALITGGRAQVLERQFDKGRVVAYLNNRGEKEVVVLPERD